MVKVVKMASVKETADDVAFGMGAELGRVGCRNVGALVECRRGHFDINALICALQNAGIPARDTYAIEDDKNLQESLWASFREGFESEVRTYVHAGLAVRRAKTGQFVVTAKV